MKMTVRRSGGFMGMRPVVVEISLEELSPADRGAIAELREDPSTGREDSAGSPDAFHYRITIDGPGSERVIKIDETRASPALRALLHRLTGG